MRHLAAKRVFAASEVGSDGDAGDTGAQCGSPEVSATRLRRGRVMVRRLAVLLATVICLAPTCLRAQTTQGIVLLPCIGDCNGDGAISINELILGVQIALGEAPLAACPAFDANGDGTV